MRPSARPLRRLVHDVYRPCPRRGFCAGLLYPTCGGRHCLVRYAAAPGGWLMAMPARPSAAFASCRHPFLFSGSPPNHLHLLARAAPLWRLFLYPTLCYCSSSPWPAPLQLFLSCLVPPPWCSGYHYRLLCIFWSGLPPWWRTFATPSLAACSPRSHDFFWAPFRWVAALSWTGLSWALVPS